MEQKTDATREVEAHVLVLKEAWECQRKAEIAYEFRRMFEARNFANRAINCYETLGKLGDAADVCKSVGWHDRASAYEFRIRYS